MVMVMVMVMVCVSVCDGDVRPGQSWWPALSQPQSGRARPQHSPSISQSEPVSPAHRSSLSLSVMAVCHSD